MKLLDICDHIEVWHDWRERYSFYVPKFINEAKTKITWSDWEEDIFYEFLEKSRNQCVSSLTQGCFTKVEINRIKQNWSAISPLLKKIAESQDAPLWGTYKELETKIREYTDSNKKAATNRLIAGLQPNLLSTIIGEKYLVQLFNYLNDYEIEDRPIYIDNDWFLNSHNILLFFKKHMQKKNPLDIVTYPWQTLDYFDKHSNYTADMNPDKSQKSLIELLKYKKQIILQGPPGTGKTKLAKELARELIFGEEHLEKNSDLTEETILRYMTPGLKFPSAKDKIEYEVEKFTNSGVSVIASTKNAYLPLFKEIIKSYKDKVWQKEGEITKGNDSYSAAVAKYIYTEQFEKEDSLIDSEYFKIIQFHPSYTYEDFVRGIVAIPNPEGEGILYESQNKLIGDFAEKSLQNYIDHKKIGSVISKENWVKDQFHKFAEDITEKIDEEGQYKLTDNVSIIGMDVDAFRYTGVKTWGGGAHRMPFKDIIQAYVDGNKLRQDLKNNLRISGSAKQHASYYVRILADFYQYLQDHKSIYNENSSAKVVLRNYILIIDEINRANLSSVLGELIYALEYRGEEVESMYAVDGSNKLILPPNLYIVGTMNTADRSVGHIDYAIRRRFAFVDVEPEDLSSVLGKDFHKEIYDEVAVLFQENYLSPEFQAKDVQLGHSYFIQQYEKDVKGLDIKDKPYNFNLRIQYEILPILMEYVKDGILNTESITIIQNIKNKYLNT